MYLFFSPSRTGGSAELKASRWPSQREPHIWHGWRNWQRQNCTPYITNRILQMIQWKRLWTEMAISKGESSTTQSLLCGSHLPAEHGSGPSPGPGALLVTHVLEDEPWTDELWTCSLLAERERRTATCDSRLWSLVLLLDSKFRARCRALFMLVDQNSFDPRAPFIYGCRVISELRYLIIEVLNQFVDHSIPGKLDRMQNSGRKVVCECFSVRILQRNSRRDHYRG